MDKKIISRKEAIEQGLDKYFTGKPCPHGHISERFTKSACCKQCQAEHSLRYYNADLEKGRAKGRANYWNHAEDRRERSRRARAIRPKKQRTIKTQEERQAYKTDWKRKDKANNPARYKVYAHKRRAAEGSYTAQEIIDIRAAQKDKCAYCSVRLNGGGHLDHIIPIAKGGTNWPRNLQWLCQPCNQKKSSSDPIDYARKTGRLL